MKAKPHPLWDEGVRTLIEASGGELNNRTARAIAGMLAASFSQDYAPTAIQEVINKLDSEGARKSAADLRAAIAKYIEQ